jgi:hypothetical protein
MKSKGSSVPRLLPLRGFHAEKAGGESMASARRLFPLSCALLFLALSVSLLRHDPAAQAVAATKTPTLTHATPKPSLEPKAIAILKAASARLAGARTMAFTAIEVFESPSRQGHPLAYTTKYEVTLQRPDKLRVDTLADGPASSFYFDGKTMTAFAPTENLVAVANAPPTVDAVLKAAYSSAAIYFPFTDVIVADPYGDMAGTLQLAYYIGQSRVVGGTTTDMVAIAGNGVFEQLWIGTDDKMPRMIRAVFLNDPDKLRHELVFSDWQIDPTLPEGTFTLAVPADAKHIKFAHPEAPKR